MSSVRRNPSPETVGCCDFIIIRHGFEHQFIVNANCRKVNFVDYIFNKCMDIESNSSDASICHRSPCRPDSLHVSRHCQSSESMREMRSMTHVDQTDGIFALCNPIDGSLECIGDLHPKINMLKYVTPNNVYIPALVLRNPLTLVVERVCLLMNLSECEQSYPGLLFTIQGDNVKSRLKLVESRVSENVFTLKPLFRRRQSVKESATNARDKSTKSKVSVSVSSCTKRKKKTSVHNCA